MVQIGRINNLKIESLHDSGLYLDGENFGKILLPNADSPESFNLDDYIDVFIYFDSEDRIIATTKKPFLMVDQIGYLQVKEITSIGAFLDWGLLKDLFLPYKEQIGDLKENELYPVIVYFDDKSNRIAASMKIEKRLKNKELSLNSGDQVFLEIYRETDLGFEAIVNNNQFGLIYKNEVFTKLKPSMKTIGYVKKVRDDGKLDLTLYRAVHEMKDINVSIILEKLNENKGFLPLNDKSDPEKIYKMLGLSKKVFKATVGMMYKSRMIIFENDGIKLIS
ncbi:MAG: GntR family transcriptional regulator [Candidatus Delongbacteria bacterium]|nr:GntR family transcriptional regulator [Candidatus Delongbacteria bacterium]MBN2835896.1 GntR family transcriptional regulator [Candidatus Delongbacteria bacterium]